jgi:signal transduction histidine kinase/CheY-like chemotaxis protein
MVARIVNPVKGPARQNDFQDRFSISDDLKGHDAMALKKLIGEILSDLGVVTNDQVEEALSRQREIFDGKTLPDRVERSRLVADARYGGRVERIPLLGQILSEMGAVSEDQLRDALNVQEEMIRKFCDLECEALCTVVDMGNRVNSSLNLLEVLSMIMHNANRVTGSVASTLMLMDEKTGDLCFSIPTGPKADTLVDVRLKKGHGIAGWVAEQNKPVIVDDAETDPRFYPGIDEMSGFRTKSILAVPLKAKNKIIGVLEVINKEDGSSFSEEDALLLTIFAEQAAMAIENARLYEELKNQIEETNRVQAQLSEIQKFQALAQLSSGLSHDFKNILNAIMGFAEIILLDVESAQIREDVEEILKAGTRAKDLLSQILNFTRQSEQNRVVIDVGNALRQAVKSIRGQIHEAIDIKEDLTAEDVRLLADPAQIHQVLLDVLKNAGEAIGKAPGSIEVGAAVVSVNKAREGPLSTLTPGSYVRIRISDNGCGMDADTRKQIFDPYFSTKDRAVGTGMSLAAVQGIVNGHGGAIEVDSAPDEGATFDIYLPHHLPAESAKRPVTAKDLPRGNERILVVDDEPPLVAILERMLGHLGYRITSAIRPETALEIFGSDPDAFDLVITDLAMPGIPGDQLTEKLQKIRPNLKVIIWTAFTEGVNMEKLSAIGVEDCLDKPVIMSDLALTVRRVLDLT